MGASPTERREVYGRTSQSGAPEAPPAPDAAAISSDADYQSQLTLDAALAPDAIAAEIAVTLLGKDSTDLDARARLAAAAADALVVLDAIGSRPCYAQWFDVSRVAWWLLARSVVDLEAIDAANMALDDAARDAARLDFDYTSRGYALLLFAGSTLHDETVCGSRQAPTAKPSPTPAGTGAP